MSDLKTTDRECSQCGEVKPPSEFHRNRSSKSGLRAQCKQCHRAAVRAYQIANPDKINQAHRRWYVENRELVNRRLTEARQRAAKYVNGLKSEPCMDCGQCFPAPAMEFDHVRGEKRALISAMANSGRPVESIRDEIAKCDLVCANCHRIRHWASPNVVALREDRNRDA